MKKILLGLLAISFVILSVSAGAADSKPSAVTIGFNPGGDPKQVRDLALELGVALQEELRLPVQIYISPDYDGLVTAMKDKKIDFAFFTAATFVKAEKEAGAKVLLKKVWSEPFYFSTLMRKVGPRLRDWKKEIKGKKIAFVDRQSASGYLYPMVELRKRGLTEKDFEVVWTGNHAASVAKLEAGEVDLIATFADEPTGKRGNGFNKFRSSESHNARALWVSGPIPNDPFAVRAEFYDKYPLVTHSVMLALIDVFDRKRDRFAGLLGAKALMPATSRQYDTVREALKEFEAGGK